MLLQCCPVNPSGRHTSRVCIRLAGLFPLVILNNHLLSSLLGSQVLVWDNVFSVPFNRVGQMHENAPLKAKLYPDIKLALNRFINPSYLFSKGIGDSVSVGAFPD